MSELVSKPVGAQFFIDGVWYKMGANENLYFFDNFDWRRSSKTLSDVTKRANRKIKTNVEMVYYKTDFRE